MDLESNTLHSEDTEYSFEYLSREAPDIIASCYGELAPIMSDQCPWHFHIVSTTEGEVRYTEGSMLKQVRDCLLTLDCLNPLIHRPGFPGLSRRFPSVALKETVYNAMLHMDYSKGRDVVVTVSSEVVSVESPGSIWMPDRWDVDLWAGTRNSALGEIMMRLGEVRLNGNGMKAITGAYRRTGKMPRVVAKDDSFLVQLPAVSDIGYSLDLKCQRARSFLRDSPGSTVRELSDTLMISLSHARRVVQKLMDDGEISYEGEDVYRRLYLNDTNPTEGEDDD